MTGSPVSHSSRKGLWASVWKLAGTAFTLLVLAVPALAQAQDDDEPACTILCTPALKIEPTFTIENLGGGPRIEAGGEVQRVGSETVFELIFALDVPTRIPRVGFTLEAIFVPSGETSVHPFTGVAAAASGRRAIRDNGIEVEAELNLDLLDTSQTGGWVSSHFDIVDKFSPGDTPRAGSVYTHKLNFEWDTAFHVFNRLPSGNWLRNVEAELSLDYVATGLPKAGDVLAGERFLDNANPWSLSFVFVFPLAPLVP
jgi:hypothetical protein